MNEYTNEGPITESYYVEHTRKTCGNAHIKCKHLEHVDHRIWLCKHPSIKPKRMIPLVGNYEIPDWCPFVGGLEVPE